MAEKLWVEKYRPSTLDEYVFHDEKQKAAFQRFVYEKSIPHLLLTGVQGTGKTTIAQVLINEIGIDDVDVLTLNASDENSVDAMRDKVKAFITSMPIGDFKVVHLDEADHISIAGQAVLRRFMEDYVDQARFILSCNAEHKIIAPIKSRSQHFRFKANDKDEVTMYCAKILKAENIKCDLETIDKYVAVGYPDIRKIVQMMQQYTSDGLLGDPTTDAETSDYKFELIAHIETDNWVQARTIACDNVANEEWEDVYRFLYENINQSNKFSNQAEWEQAIVIIADHLYKHSICADPEINAAAMFVRLGQI